MLSETREKSENANRSENSGSEREASAGKRSSVAVEEKNTAAKITKEDVDVLRTIPRKSINEFTDEEIKKAEPWARKFYAELGTKSPFFRAWFGDWRAYDKIKVVIVSKIFDSYE